MTSDTTNVVNIQENHLNDLAAEIYQVNVDHGFAEPIPLEVAQKASTAFATIRDIVDEFETLRKDPNFKPDLGRMVNSNTNGFARVKLLLVISEIIEVLDSETIQDHDEEVADIFIRLLDYAFSSGVNLDREIATKVRKNRDRPYKHNRNF